MIQYNTGTARFRKVMTYTFSSIRAFYRSGLCDADKTWSGSLWGKTLFRSVIILLITLINIPEEAAAQYTMKLVAADSGQAADLASLAKASSDIKSSYPDTATRRKALTNFIYSLYPSGYLAASCDQVIGDGNNMSAVIHLGERFKWGRLKKGNVDERILSASGFREKIYKGKAFNPSSTKKLIENIITYCENNGYPFAVVRLDSLQFDGNMIYGSLDLEKNELIKIDSIIVKGDSKTSEIYINNYLGVKPGNVYDEASIKKISTRFKELPFVAETRPFNVSFTGDKAKVFLYLTDKKASQVDGVIGFLPDNEKGGKITVTGEARIKLDSPFGRGEYLDINWKQSAYKTQDLKVKAGYPYIVLQFGLELNLDIYKKDTSYLEIGKGAGIQFQLTGTDYMKGFFYNKKSSLLSTSSFETYTTLPPFADMTTNTYGLNFRNERLDYRLNPRKGYILELTGGISTRTIEKNTKLTSSLYDSLELNTVQYRGEYRADAYFPLSGRSIIDIGSIGGFLIGDQLFQNELFRYGGLRTLRGFDEESILATSFYMGKLEYRYLLEQNSFLFLFFNAAWYENHSRDVHLSDTPFGFGAGINFETKLGIFSLNYALGKQFDNPIFLRSGKIHFGIVNYF
jgi:outer membrane protein assembly factor BamA